MIKKTMISILLFVGLVSMTFTVSAADQTLTIKDDLDDVYDAYNEEYVSKLDFDIFEISAEKTGKEVTLKLKLKEGGIIQESSLASINLYSIALITTGDTYAATYVGDNLIDLFAGQDGFEDLDDEEGLEQLSYACSVETSKEVIDVETYSGGGQNILSITFDLYSSDEELINLQADVYQMMLLSSEIYEDDLYPNDLYPESGGDSGKYYIEAGGTVNLIGDLEEGDPDDYNWAWVLDDSGGVLKGQTASKKFSIPKNYSGTLHVYSDDGTYYGVTQFFVQVNQTGTNNNNNGENNQPGFELVIFIGAIIAALVIFKKRQIK